MATRDDPGREGSTVGAGVAREESGRLLDGGNHIAWISRDAERLGRFYERVFDAVIGPTRSHGPGETMTVIDIGPATQLNVFVIDGNTEADRQVPMWGGGRIDRA